MCRLENFYQHNIRLKSHYNLTRRTREILKMAFKSIDWSYTTRIRAVVEHSVEQWRRVRTLRRRCISSCSIREQLEMFGYNDVCNYDAVRQDNKPTEPLKITKLWTVHTLEKFIISKPVNTTVFTMTRAFRRTLHMKLRGDELFEIQHRTYQERLWKRRGDRVSAPPK